MSKLSNLRSLLPWLQLLCVGGFLAVISWRVPPLTSDENTFLKEFLDVDVLSVLAFIVAVTLASTANIHFHLNGLQERTGLTFPRTRGSLKRSAFSLIILFGIAVIVVVVKPVVGQLQWAQQLLNCIAILVIYFNLEVLWDLTKATFKIPAASEIPRS